MRGARRRIWNGRTNHWTCVLGRGRGLARAAPVWLRGSMSLRTEMFDDIDRMDAGAWAAYLAEDVSFRFGNEPAVHGREAAREALASFYELIADVRHDVQDEWDIDGTAIVEAEVTYTRKDGSAVTVPVVTIYRTAPDGLIADYRVYADVAPVFA
jgi:ketosteroid isomerase-like protein